MKELKLKASRVRRVTTVKEELKFITPYCDACDYWDEECYDCDYNEKICVKIARKMRIHGKNGFADGTDVNGEGTDFIKIGYRKNTDRINAIIAMYKLKYSTLNIRLSEEKIKR